MKPTLLTVALCCLASIDHLHLLGKRCLPELVHSTAAGLASFQFPPREFFPTLKPLSVSPCFPRRLCPWLFNGEAKLQAFPFHRDFPCNTPLVGLPSCSQTQPHVHGLQSTALNLQLLIYLLTCLLSLSPSRHFPTAWVNFHFSNTVNLAQSLVPHTY